MEGRIYPKEREIIITTLGMLIIICLYALIVYNKYVLPEPEIINDPKFWGLAFVIMAPVMIVTMILLMILYAIMNKIITNQEISTVSDERDKLIDMKAMRITQVVNGLGMFLAIGSQALGMELWVLFAVLISSCFVGMFSEGITKIYFYRRGF